MSPLALKFGIPMAILGIVAAMRWFNVQTSGEPFFPGVGDTESKKGGGGGSGGIPKTQAGEVTSDPGSQQNDYYPYDPEVTDPPPGDTPSDEWQGEISTPGPGATNISGAMAQHPGSNVGGFNIIGGPTGPVAGAITQVTSGGGGYTGGYIPYQPYSPTPQTNTPVLTAAGTYRTSPGVYAI